MRFEKPTGRRFRLLFVGTVVGSAAIGGTVAYLLGGVGAAIFSAIVVGVGAGFGFWLPSRMV
ncbi:MAG: hypothetical protein ACRDNC_07990 [Gaiellaceae bacterium]